VQKLELFSNETVFTKDDEATEESPRRTLKLFGTTLLVNDTCKPSSTSTDASKPVPSMHLTQQLQRRCSDIGLATVVPWWTLSDNSAFKPPHKEHEGENSHSNNREREDKETQKDGSCVGSNTSSINDGESNERESQCLPIRHKTFGKGFVPYKRCMTERESHCSTITDERREHQRMRLSL
jgi:hypothetical protein